MWQTYSVYHPTWDELLGISLVLDRLKLGSGEGCSTQELERRDG